MPELFTPTARDFTTAGRFYLPSQAVPLEPV